VTRLLRFSKLAPVMLGAFLASGADAQPELGHIISGPSAARIKKEGTQQGDVVRGTINAYGRCLIARNRRGATAAVSAPSDSPAQNRLLEKVTSSACLEEGELRMPHALVRGAIYRALYRADYGRNEPTLLVKPIDWSDGRSVDPSTATGYAVVLRQFADCVVRSNPSAARALTLAREQSPEEAATFDRMKPALGQCIPPRAKIAFSRSSLFSLLSEVLYRDSASPAGLR
jgi:hypothetical protein